MTMEIMRVFGAAARLEGGSFLVRGMAGYEAREYTVEPDVSAATVFGAAAAITGITVEIPGIPRGTLQGDLAFFGLLRSMGCAVVAGEGGIVVGGGGLRGIEADMNALPDSVPALAVAAAFASTPTAVTNVAHLRHKESDRIAALVSELGKIGALAGAAPGGLTVAPAPLRAAEIETYDDHRIAMSFAVAGLALDGMRIRNPGCVAKSFPGFWTELEKFN
jgi:3-phosphoshikimate 1-carboxyvinyltransferase